jgi:hypothetical protein
MGTELISVSGFVNELFIDIRVVESYLRPFDFKISKSSLVSKA